MANFKLPSSVALNQACKSKRDFAISSILLRFLPFCKIIALCSLDFKIVAAFNKIRTSIEILYFLAYFNQINFPHFHFFFLFVQNAILFFQN